MPEQLNLNFEEIKRIITNAKENKLTEEDLQYLDKLGNLIAYVEHLKIQKG